MFLIIVNAKIKAWEVVYSMAGFSLSCLQLLLNWEWIVTSSILTEFNSVADVVQTVVLFLASTG